MGITESGFLLHLYYGPKAQGKLGGLLTFADRGYSGNPYEFRYDRSFSLDALPQEYPNYGNGDFRSPAFRLRDESGVFGTDLRYESHRMIPGKYKIPGLPAVYAEEYFPNDSSAAPAQNSGASSGQSPVPCSNHRYTSAYTLEVILSDSRTGIKVKLLFGVLPELDVITRCAAVKNMGNRTVYLNKVNSMSLDFLTGSYDLIHFHGRHAMERNFERIPVISGTQSFGSLRGTSSHQHNPFFILADRETTEDFGNCYGVSFLYSGNFKFEVERDQYSQTRVQIGISDEMFDYKLEPGEVFHTPEAALAYTGNGLSALSHMYHRLIRHHICRGFWKEKRRPVLINNWEATYFDFTGEKILSIAGEAANLGIEMFVLDDGWFGKRDDDNSGLGDWYVNEKKLGKSLTELSEEIHKMNMLFGLWIEPEMISEDSDLYREHPDWAFVIPDKKPVMCRNQLVLDFSRKEVVDVIYEMMAKILSEAKVSYIKWDMNRSITECFSFGLPPERQGEVYHRYILGVYDLYERLTREFPEILFESCASGGGRFDPGMLYYAPQGWTSDDTDAAERMKIQYGTSMCYPVSSMGSHVSMIPNHQVNRQTPLHTRANVAYFGTFGYELDLNRLTEEEIQEVKQQIVFMKEYRTLLQFGTFYRLKSPFEGNEMAWMVVSQDKRTAVVGWYRIMNVVNGCFTRLRLQGLEADLCYRNSQSGSLCYGDELMNLGLSTTDATAGEVAAGEESCTDYESRIYLLEAQFEFSHF